MLKDRRNGHSNKAGDQDTAFWQMEFERIVSRSLREIVGAEVTKQSDILSEIRDMIRDVRNEKRS